MQQSWVGDSQVDIKREKWTWHGHGMCRRESRMVTKGPKTHLNMAAS